jgi:CubicO group peptidase (beta-lactamase class C family)
MAEISGAAPPRFSRVKDAFAALFDEGQELGAQFAVAIDGEVVVDLNGGFADRGKTRAVGPETLFPIFSSGKAVMALLMARLVEAGKIGYDQTVASAWPEFGQAGKDKVTLAQALSHQAGLPGFSPPQESTIWFDTAAVLAALCAQAPMWPLGTGSGYHPITIGYLMNELHRRVDGRSMGQMVEHLRESYGLDYWIGLPDAEHDRVVELLKPPAAPDLGPLDAIKRAAFLDKGSAPGGRGTAEWRRIEVPSANAHATAPALARLLGIVATGGRLEGRAVLSPATLAQATRERVHGPDKVLPFTLSWGAGLLRNRGIRIYGPSELAVGHSGWGGSCAFADPETRVSAAYVMNKQSPHLIGDPRPLRLIEALYAAL